MPKTSTPSKQVRDGEGVRRSDLCTTQEGDAVIAKAIPGPGVSLQSTGADPGTGDVTIVVDAEATYQYAESEAESITSSSQFQTKLTLTTAELEAGNYRIEWSSEISQNNITDATEVIVEVEDSSGSVQTINNPEIEPKDRNNWYTVGSFKVLALSGINDITIKFREQRGGIAQIRYSRIEIKKVG